MVTSFELHEGTPPTYETYTRLSPTERAVLSAICEGKTNAQIADERGISKQTIKNHIANIFIKLEVTNRIQAFIKALQLGYVQPIASIDAESVKASIKFTKLELIRLDNELDRLNKIYAEMEKHPNE